MAPIRLSYFSDVLCVWAYIAQVRLDELQSSFPDNIAIDYHFTPVFGDVHRKLEARWRDKGGLQAYSDHVKGVAAKFSHIKVHPDIWTQSIPHSSTSCHLFLRAIKRIEEQGGLKSPKSGSWLEKVTWMFREAFFTQLTDVCDRKVQFEIARSLSLPVTKIKAQIDSGEAYADLSRDFELAKEHAVTVSPTLIFNEGRQRLNGNVGYRVIEANIRELLHNPPGEQSWC